MKSALAAAVMLAAAPLFAASPTSGREGRTLDPAPQVKDDAGADKPDFGPYPPGSLSAPPVSRPRSAGAPPLIVYSKWSETKRWKGTLQTEWSFNSGGPGTTISVGFVAQDHAQFHWVESVNSTDSCQYLAWISEKPGGAPLAPKACAPIETGYTGGVLHFSPVINNKVEAQWICPVTKGGQYFFNLKLLRWAPNPYANNIYSCVEHVLPQGNATSIFNE